MGKLRLGGHVLVVCRKGMASGHFHCNTSGRKTRSQLEIESEQGEQGKEEVEEGGGQVAVWS